MKQQSRNPFSFIKNIVKDSLSKFHYFPCEKGDLHQGEKLTYVCLNKQCQEKGLICSVCKQQHNKHEFDVIPLKTLMSKLADIKDTIPSFYSDQKGVKQFLQIIEQTRNKIMYQLRITVQKLSECFRQLQQMIMSSFSQTKIEVLKQISLKMNLKPFIEETLQNINGDQNIFRKNIFKISNIVEKTNIKNQIDFKDNLTGIVNKYQSKSSFTLQNLKSICQNNIEFFKVFSKQANILQKMNQTLKQATKPVVYDQVFGNLFTEQQQFSEKMAKSQQSPMKYTFSTLLKGNTILVQKNGIVAKQTKTGSPSRFVLVGEGLGKKQQKITFKIIKLVNWIGIGICIRQIITKGKYTFNYEKIGHGSYLLSSNGFSWSHSQTDQNIKDRTFAFTQGDIIDVYLTSDYLKFVKRSTKKQLKLKLNLKPYQWSNICFCANICSADDKIQIINEGS